MNTSVRVESLAVVASLDAISGGDREKYNERKRFSCDSFLFLFSFLIIRSYSNVVFDELGACYDRQ